MTLDWNPDALKRLQELALEGAAQHLRERLEVIYCEVHGHFVEQIELTAHQEKLEAHYETCCDAQRQEVERAIQDVG